jgi:hypothetical protein
MEALANLMSDLFWNDATCKVNTVAWITSHEVSLVSSPPNAIFSLRVSRKARSFSVLLWRTSMRASEISQISSIAANSSGVDSCLKTFQVSAEDRNWRRCSILSSAEDPETRCSKKYIILCPYVKILEATSWSLVHHFNI